MNPLTYTVMPATPTPGAAASQAYTAASGLPDAGIGGPGDAGAGFGAMLNRAMEGAISIGHDADRKSVAAIQGTGSVTDVVTAVSKAELALQTTAAIRDRLVQAYQDIMRMPI